jgi:WD40 repeat protein
VWTAGHLDDGRRFAAGQTGQIRVWGKGPSKDVAARASVALGLGKDRLLVGGWEKLSIADLAGKVQDVGAHQGWAGGLALSPRRDVALVGDVAGTARLWDLRTFSLRCQLAGSASLRAAAFHPSGASFAVAANDGRVVVADAETCAATRTLRADRGRVSTVAAGTTVLLGDGMGNVTTWSPEELRQLRADHVHEGGLMGLTLVPGGGWVSTGQDTNLVHAPPNGTPHQLFHLRYLPHKLRALSNAPSVVVVDMSGHAHVVPLDGSTPRDFYSVPGVIFASVAVRPGKSELVIGGSMHTVHKHTLPHGAVDWATAGAGSTSLAYSRDGTILAEGNSGGELAFRDPDSGDVRRRLTGLSREIVAIHFTPTHVWAGGFDQKLLRWPLQGGTAAELELPEGSGIYEIASTADDRYLVVGLDDGAMIHALPDGTPLARLIPFRDLSWAAIYADGRYVVSPGAAREMRVEDPATRRVLVLGQPSPPASIASMALSRLPGGPARVHATVLSYDGPPQVRLDDRWPIAAVTPSVGNLAAYDVDFLLKDADGAPHRLTVIPRQGDKVSRDFVVLPAIKGPQGKAPVIGAASPAFAGSGVAVMAESLVLGGPVRGLAIHVVPVEDAAALRVALHPVGGDGRAEVEAYFAGGYKKAKRAAIKVPIHEELRAGRYEVRVEACQGGQGCTREAGVRFEVEVR